MGVALAPPPCAAAGVLTLGSGRPQPGQGHHGFARPTDQRCPTAGQRELVRAAAELGEGSGGAGACQSGALLGVEERRRRQRLQHEIHQRAAAAAATGRAYAATLEQRERQRTAVEQEAERLRAEWAAAAAAGTPRRGPVGPGARRPGAGSSSSRAAGRPSSTSSGGGGPGAAASSGAAADNTASSRREAHQPRDARFWLLYAMHWRHFESEATSFDADDCWGRGPSAGAASGSGSEGAATGANSGAAAGAAAGGGPDYDFWRQFVREATKGFRAKQSAAWGSAASSWANAAHGWGGARASGQRQQHEAAAAAGAGASLEQQVRAELTAALAQAGGDLARFVSELGIPFERAADRRALLRNARTAALLRLHPDKLRASDERQQVFGLLATQILNELWMAEKAAARA